MLNMEVKQELRQLAVRVKLLLLDVDGVLTDGRIIYDSRGRDSKFFDVHDGMGVYALHKAGIKTVLITAKGSRAIIPRARDMHVAEVLVADKLHKHELLGKVLAKHQVNAEEVAFVGDDLVDLGIMKKVGFPIAVFNACSEVKLAASYITLNHGGRGAVREVAELILKSQDKWEQIVKLYDV
jgi:3-deoxy-D-manno-octulosonate 8-phosphate phosphatase (KDO 8-P phosphatase)